MAIIEMAEIGTWEWEMNTEITMRSHVRELTREVTIGHGLLKLGDREMAVA